MDRGIYVSMTGAKQMMLAQSNNDNNIANANTTGFRADSISFTSEPIYGAGYASRVNAVTSESGTDFSSGVETSTGRPLDIAVTGNGFIAVQGADGKEAYTRAGDLKLTVDGLLTTSNGLPVLTVAAGTLIVPQANTVTIGSDGTVSVVPLGLAANAQSQVDAIKLVNPPVSELKKGADGLFRLKSGLPAPLDPTVTLQSGVLESSNVNAAQTLVNMIELQRQYEFQVKSMNAADTDEQSAEQMMLSSS
jgi:flagellar basal-body rod protein FlgF